MRHILTSVLSLGFIFAAGAFSSTANAVAVLELECRIDNRVMSSAPRVIKLRAGMIETIDCQTHSTCSQSIYEIDMNYNSTGEKVSVSVRDTETKKSISTDFTVLPNTTGNSLNDASFNLGYGDTLTSLEDIEKLDPKGRFLVIDCDRLN